MVAIRRILCPVDFSDFSRHALDYAAGIARWYGARITALHVVPPIASMLPVSGEGLYPPLVFRPEDLDQFRTELASFVRPSGIEALDAEVVQGRSEERRVGKECR